MIVYWYGIYCIISLDEIWLVLQFFFVLVGIIRVVDVIWLDCFGILMVQVVCLVLLMLLVSQGKVVSYWVVQVLVVMEFLEGWYVENVIVDLWFVIVWDFEVDLIYDFV